MRTYPMWREDKTLHAFEIPNSRITVRGLRALLCSIPGVTNATLCGPFGEDRIMFEYLGEQCVVWEPFGDNSRFWIGSKTPDNSSVDIKPIHDALIAYRQPMWIVILWALLVITAIVFAFFSYAKSTAKQQAPAQLRMTYWEKGKAMANPALKFAPCSRWDAPSAL